MRLTEGYMMDPESSVSALIFHNPLAKYFTLSAADIEALDRELSHGERWVAGVDQLERLAAPLKSIARAALESKSRAREHFRRPRATDATDDASSI